jgi:phenylacetaldehyde dehydrogenase
MISDAAQARAASFTLRPRELFIAGRWQAAQSGETFDVVDPANERVFARAASGGEADIDVAVKAARKAFESPPWSAMTPAQRARLLLKLADLIEANADEIAPARDARQRHAISHGQVRRRVRRGREPAVPRRLGDQDHGATINLSFPG